MQCHKVVTRGWKPAWSVCGSYLNFRIQISNFKFENLKFSEILNLKFEIDLLASAERCQNSAGE